MGFTPCVSRSRVRAGLPCSRLLFSEERWRLLLASPEALPFHRCVKHFFWSHIHHSPDVFDIVLVQGVEDGHGAQRGLGL